MGQSNGEWMSGKVVTQGLVWLRGGRADTRFFLLLARGAISPYYGSV